MRVAVHAIRLVAIPEKMYTPTVMAWLGMAILLPVLVIPFRGYLKKEQTR